MVHTIYPLFVTRSPWKREIKMKNQKSHRFYDLEERTLRFAKNTRKFVKLIPEYSANREDGRQLIRSSGSIGANYIEANEALGKKDFLFRLKICRKEAKETRYWLNLLDIDEQSGLHREHQALFREATELMNIFGSIIRKIQ